MEFVGVDFLQPVIKPHLLPSKVNSSHDKTCFQGSLKMKDTASMAVVTLLQLTHEFKDTIVHTHIHTHVYWRLGSDVVSGNRWNIHSRNGEPSVTLWLSSLCQNVRPKLAYIIDVKWWWWWSDQLSGVSS